jgi:hypothetical protein
MNTPTSMPTTAHTTVMTANCRTTVSLYSAASVCMASPAKLNRMTDSGTGRRLWR